MSQLVTTQSTKGTTAPVNPRVELRKVIEANMKKDKLAHYRLFSDLLFEGLDKSDLSGSATDLLKSVVDAWFSLNYSGVLRDAETNQLAAMHKSSSKREQARAAKIVEARNAEIAERKAKRQAIAEIVAAETSTKLAATASGIRKIMLLDTITLPNGKKLRDSTGAECGKAGGHLSRISLKMAERGISNGLVGDNMTEKQVQALLLDK